MMRLVHIRIIQRDHGPFLRNGGNTLLETIPVLLTLTNGGRFFFVCVCSNPLFLVGGEKQRHYPIIVVPVRMVVVNDKRRAERTKYLPAITKYRN